MQPVPGFPVSLASSDSFPSDRAFFCTMTSTRITLCLVLLGLFAPLHAQSGMQIPYEFRPVRNNAFSVGVRFIGGANIRFGNLGSVPSNLTIPGLSIAPQAINYANGSVGLDALREAEKDANGNQSSPQGGRYTVTGGVLDANGNPVLDANGNVVTQTIGDYLGYRPGYTRVWSYANTSQATSNPGFIAMNDYSSESNGATAEADAGPGPGFEFTYVRKLGSFGGKIELGLLFGAGLTDINGKTSGEVKATLKTLTDLYSLGGQAAPAAPFVGPSYTNYTAGNGTVFASAFETTVPLSALPSSRTNTTTANGASVTGTWQIKGAYFLFRAGPVLRIPINNRVAINASAGFAGAYIGTTYRIDESLNVAGVLPIRVEGEEAYKKFMAGAYAEINAEWLITERTGFFAGVTAETLDKYEQTLAGRTAAVSIGSNAGIRLGVTTRF